MIKVIKVLGTGCPKCKTMTSVVNDVIKENNIEAIVEKVEDIMKIMEYNVMATPALVIDGVITIKGRIPSKEEVLSLLKTSKSVEDSNSNNSYCSGTSCC